MAFFAAADVMLVTPLRDGMNLVAKEYVACRHDDGGVLVLSEFTGAAHRAARTRVLVNPHDTDGVKNALHAALTMDPAEARRRMRALRRQVLTHDVDRWARAFLDALGPARDGRRRRMSALDEAVRALAAAPRLLVALDFDGVLAPIVAGALRRPRRCRAAVGAIQALAALPGTTVALVSGRGLADLAAVSGFGAPGAADRQPRRRVADADGAVAARRRGRAPGSTGSTAELRELVDGEPGVHAGGQARRGRGARAQRRARRSAARVLDAVRAGPAAAPGSRPRPGKEVLDLAVLEVSKGLALDRLRERIGADAVFFAGDDVTDETAFARLRPGDVGREGGRRATRPPSTACPTRRPRRRSLLGRSWLAARRPLRRHSA